MKLIALVALLASSAFAADYQRNNTNFTIPVFADNGARVYYNCDSVENRVERVLEEMGAVVHSVRCTGGLDVTGGRFHMPARVNAIYDTVNSELDGNVVTMISNTRISQRDNCHLNYNIVKAVRNSFEIYKLSSRRCMRSNARTRIDMTVLTAK